jgi:hypothetical protein
MMRSEESFHTVSISLTPSVANGIPTNDAITLNMAPNGKKATAAKCGRTARATEQSGHRPIQTRSLETVETAFGASELQRVVQDVLHCVPRSLKFSIPESRQSTSHIAFHHILIRKSRCYFHGWILTRRVSRRKFLASPVGPPAISVLEILSRFLDVRIPVCLDLQHVISMPRWNRQAYGLDILSIYAPRSTCWLW